MTRYHAQTDTSAPISRSARPTSPALSKLYRSVPRVNFRCYSRDMVFGSDSYRALLRKCFGANAYLERNPRIRERIFSELRPDVQDTIVQHLLNVAVCELVKEQVVTEGNVFLDRYPSGLACPGLSCAGAWGGRGGQHAHGSAVRHVVDDLDADGKWAASTAKRPPRQPAQPPVLRLLGPANAATTPQGTPAAAADRTQRPDATCEGKNG